MSEKYEASNVWTLALPFLRGVIDEGLRAAEVPHSSQVRFDEWIGGEPTLAVTWLSPQGGAGGLSLGKSVSFMLEGGQRMFTFRMFGAVWTDDLSQRLRHVRQMQVKEFVVDSHAGDQFKKIQHEIIALVREVATSTLGQESIEVRLPA